MGHSRSIFDREVYTKTEKSKETRYFLRIKTFSCILFPKISFSSEQVLATHTQIYLSAFLRLLSTVPGTVVLI